MKNLIGKRVGRLVVTEESGRTKRGSVIWKCLCDCGNEKLVSSNLLSTNHTRSCGCLSDEHKKSLTKTGLSKTRIYGIYEGIKKRCYCKTSQAYKHYGGRGISICEEWLKDFKSFYDWSIDNGYSETLTIDRIDNNGNYEPNNCRWVDRNVQASNTRKNLIIEYNGKKQTAIQWSRETNIPNTTIVRRFKKYKNPKIVFFKGNLHKVFKNKEKYAHIFQ